MRRKPDCLVGPDTDAVGGKTTNALRAETWE